jgi:hypothetical protein
MLRVRAAVRLAHTESESSTMKHFPFIISFVIAMPAWPDPPASGLA